MSGVVSKKLTAAEQNALTWASIAPLRRVAMGWRGRSGGMVSIATAEKLELKGLIARIHQGNRACGLVPTPLGRMRVNELSEIKSTYQAREAYPHV